MQGRKPKNEKGVWPYISLEFPEGTFTEIETDLFAGSLSVKFQTREHPNLEDLVKLADYFGLDFEVFSVEQESEFYGAARYSFFDSTLSHTWIAERDLVQIGYDDQRKEYLYGELSFRLQDDCLAHVLKEKLDVLGQPIGHCRWR